VPARARLIPRARASAPFHRMRVRAQQRCVSAPIAHGLRNRRRRCRAELAGAAPAGNADRRVPARSSLPKMKVTGVNSDAARQNRRRHSNDPKDDNFELARRSQPLRVRRCAARHFPEPSLRQEVKSTETPPRFGCPPVTLRPRKAPSHLGECALACRLRGPGSAAHQQSRGPLDSGVSPLTDKLRRRFPRLCAGCTRWATIRVDALHAKRAHRH
jgi:hypothetical protein